MKLTLHIERYTLVRNGRGWDAACEGVLTTGAGTGVRFQELMAVNSGRWAVCTLWRAKRELKRKARGIIRGEG